MAALSAQTLQRLADETGHQPGTPEMALRLLGPLQEIARDRVLANRLVLKGRTALNLVHFGLDQLSVDIDLNYVGGRSTGPRWKPNAPTLTLRLTVSSRPRDTAFAAGLTPPARRRQDRQDRRGGGTLQRHPADAHPRHRPA